MNEKVKNITGKIKEKWTGFSKAIKIMIIAIPVAIIAIIIILSIILSHKDRGVLFSGLTTAEAGEIVTAINSLGVTDVTLRDNGDIVVPTENIDSLRMQLSVQGYPKNAKNYDIWNDGVNLWSTDTDKRELQRQQRETNIAATLRNLDVVASATVTLDIPKTRDYVITETKEVPRCSVLLKLRSDDELTNAEVRGIFRLVETSVENLTIDNISVTDTLGRSYMWISEEEELNGQKDLSGVPVARKRLQFLSELQNAITGELRDSLATVYGDKNYTVNVSATLNYDAKKVESTEYVPVDGTNTGVLDHDQHVIAYDRLDTSGNVIGTTPNADLSPDYPTIEGLVDGQDYYYRKDENQYDVTNIKTTIEKDGYSIDRLTVGVAINRTNLTDGERDQIREWVAAAAGTDIANVAVHNEAFALTTNNGTTVGDGSLGIYTRPVDTFRNTLLFVVIGLGVLLVLLLIASLFVSKSRKRKIRHRQELALAAAQASGGDGYSGNAQNTAETPQEVDFNIASLTEEAGKDSRETILKREIADFAKTNPEIVASIIKNMLRDENH
ncbi:MAG TPA: flagellar M-ring protein FliF [Ruminococcaceae bacterium]|nr:flagellar M-ring protein FliF [Oscillospiraceae bacterium]